MKGPKQWLLIFLLIVVVTTWLWPSVVGQEEEEEGDDHDHDEHEEAIDHFMETYGGRHWHGLTFTEFSKWYDDLRAHLKETAEAASAEEEGGGGHTHDHRTALRQKRAQGRDLVQKLARASARRQSTDPLDDEDAELECPDALAIFSRYDEDVDLILDRAELAEAATEMLKFVLDDCEATLAEEASADETTDCREVRTLDRWFGALASVLFVSVMSVAGVILLPVSSNRSSWLRKVVMGFMVAFAVGALVSDAVLHILPEVYGSATTEWESVGYSLVILAGVFTFYLLEKCLHWVMDLNCLPCGGRQHGEDHDHCHGSGHSHIDMVGALESRKSSASAASKATPKDVEAQQPTNKDFTELRQSSNASTSSSSLSSTTSMQPLDEAPVTLHHHNQHHHSRHHHEHGHGHDDPSRYGETTSEASSEAIGLHKLGWLTWIAAVEQEDAKMYSEDLDLENGSILSNLINCILCPMVVYREIAVYLLRMITGLLDVEVYGWLNVFGDAFHNFIDGVAIGVAYNSSFSLGIATTVAIIFHEIPQELGDFAVLIHAGFTRPMAIALNLLVALTSVLGVLLGLGIGTASESANTWLLAYTAGGFLYVALADMLPELVELQGIFQLVIQSSAMFLGGVAMFLILIMEIYADFNIC